MEVGGRWGDSCLWSKEEQQPDGLGGLRSKTAWMFGCEIREVPPSCPPLAREPSLLPGWPRTSGHRGLERGLLGAALCGFPSQAQTARGTLGKEGSSGSRKLARKRCMSLIRGQKLGTEPSLFVPQDVADPWRPWRASCCNCPGALDGGSRGLTGLVVVMTEGQAEEGRPPHCALARTKADGVEGGTFGHPRCLDQLGPLLWIWDLQPKQIHRDPGQRPRTL